MVLMATDLPEPVVPATRRWGMRARSTITGSPPMVLPSAIGRRWFDLLEVFAGEKLTQKDGLAALVRQFDADGVAALNHRDTGRDGRHRTGDVVGEPDDARGFDARRRLELVEGDDRSRPHVEMSPLTPKSSRTPSSRRAFCSSESCEILAPVDFFGSVNIVIEGMIHSPRGRADVSSGARTALGRAAGSGETGGVGQEANGGES